MSLIATTSMWLLVTYALIASASLSDRIVPLCTRQSPTRLRVREHQEHYQEMCLQAAIHMTSLTPLLAAASILPSYQTVDNETVLDLLNLSATHINTTQLANSLQGLDLARGAEDSWKGPIEEQINNENNDLIGEECPTGFDMLDCEDCGGPEQTWETRRHDYRCIGIEVEDCRWRNCSCLSWDDSANWSHVCTFNSNSDDDSSQRNIESDHGSRHGPNLNNDTRDDSNQDDHLRYDSACEVDDEELVVYQS